MFGLGTTAARKNRVGMASMEQSRSTHPAYERPLPVGFIEPCQPVVANQVPTGPEWMHEPVWNGYRIVARRYRSVVRLWSCDGQDWAGVFPAIVDAIRALPTDSIMIDGEAVYLREDGSPEFDAPLSKTACRGARLIAFDLLTVAGRDLRPNPFHERRTKLAFLLNEEPYDGLWFSSHVEGHQGEALFRYACSMDLAGIVSKRRDKPYRSGPCRDLLKVKCEGHRRPCMRPERPISRLGEQEEGMGKRKPIAQQSRCSM
jgi:bifunctional non-homologous end joining protein LigD